MQQFQRVFRLGVGVAVCMAAALAFVASAQTNPAPPKRPIVEIKTTKGVITVELWPDKAPKTVRNFLDYVMDGHYNDTIFHRVVKGFVIQGGGYQKDLVEKTPLKDPVPLEAKEPNRRYTLAMARTPDPNSAQAQFFINLNDNTSLDPTQKPPGYTVFGKVIKGTSVVDQIGQLPRDPKDPPFTNMTNPVVVILSMTVVP